MAISDKMSWNSIYNIEEQDNQDTILLLFKYLFIQNINKKLTY